MSTASREALHIKMEDATVLSVGSGNARHTADAVAHPDRSQTKTYDLIRDYVLELEDDQKKAKYVRYFFAVFGVVL